MTFQKVQKYQYVKTNNLYYCLKQNAVVLAWVLFFTKSSLDPLFWAPMPSKGHNFLRWSKNNYHFLKVRLEKLIDLLRYKYRLKRPESSILLPAYGHVCKPAHKGYKIFDLRRKRVIKIFDDDVDRQSVVDEIEKLREILEISFAPSIRRWNTEEYWYEEDYIDGFPDVDRSYKPLLDSSGMKEMFHKNIAPRIEAIMLFQKPQKKKLSIYTDEITKTLKKFSSYREKTESDETNKMKEFISSITEQLNTMMDCSVYLLFTHGDFCSANILNTNDSIKVIDWEHTTYRSALFDFYSYFFYRPYRGRISTNDMALEINKLLPLFVAGLREKAADISDSIISMPKVYRWLYYLERISMLLEREKTDTNLDIRKRILRFIEMYQEYETLCPDS